MSLHDAVEIKQREADLQKSAWPRLVSTGLFGLSLLIFLCVMANALGTHSQSRDAYPLLMMAVGGLYLACVHSKNRRRIEVLELELLKLRRELSFKKSA